MMRTAVFDVASPQVKYPRWNTDLCNYILMDT